MKTLKISSILLLITMLPACSLNQLSDASHISTNEAYPATNAEKITILFEAPSQAYTVIGIVDSNGLGFTKDKSKDRAIIALKEEAASMGAQAIIITSSNTGTARSADGDPAGKESTFSGKAIRMNAVD